MHSGFVNMQDRLKFETGRLHFRHHIAVMVLLSHLTNFSKSVSTSGNKSKGEDMDANYLSTWHWIKIVRE